MWRVLRQRDFALLWFGGLLSIAGNWTMVVGFPLYVYDETGSTLATGGTFLAAQVPQVLFGSVAGVLVDRWDRRRTLLLANVVLAAVVLWMLLGIALDALWLLYVVMFILATLQQLVRPAEDALLPRLVGRPEDLVAGNALNALNDNLARLSGPTIGALAYAASGLVGVVVLDAVSFAAAALLVALIRADGRPLLDVADEDLEGDVASAWVARWREWVAGLRLVRSRRQASIVITFAALVGLGEGTMGALLVPFVRDVLEAGDEVLGFIFSAQAVGSLIGGLLVGRFAGSFSAPVLLGFGALGLAAFDAAIFLSPAAVPGPWLVIALFFLVGVPISGLFVGLATLRQTSVPDAFRGRMMGTYGTTFALTAAIGTSVAGFLGEFVPLVPLLMTQVAAYAAGGLLVLAAVRPPEASR